MKRTALALLALVAACGDDAAPASDVTTATDADVTTATDADLDGDAAAPDADVAPDTRQGDDVYGPVAPPAPPAPEVRASARWVDHYVEDLEPYWTTAVALGTPVGNFPTFRGMQGALSGSTNRRPRMLARQIYAYSAGYLMTGDANLLADAAAGVAWLRAHALDRTHGGCYPELDQSGNAIDGDRTAQDHAYCMLGVAAWFYVTRDPAAEADLLALRALVFDPTAFWNAAAGRVRDALKSDMRTEVDVEGDGGAELVAQLDQVNAWLLLVQPVMTRAEDRQMLLDDLRRLGQILVDDFYQDGWFWGVSNKKGAWGSKHADFGHSMKSAWMLRAIDQRLPDHPFAAVVATTARALLDRAYDAPNGRWAKRPTSATALEYGSDWWQYAEADQLAATLDMAGGALEDRLSQTQAHWLSDYVDTKYPVREVIPSVKRDGSPAWGWPPGDTAKCNEWKNGYHSSEHALVMSLVGAWREGIPATLHFAVPPADAATFIATPYIFHGRETSRTQGDAVVTDGVTRTAVTVQWTDLW